MVESEQSLETATRKTSEGNRNLRVILLYIVICLLIVNIVTISMYRYKYPLEFMYLESLPSYYTYNQSVGPYLDCKQTHDEVLLINKVDLVETKFYYNDCLIKNLPTSKETVHISQTNKIVFYLFYYQNWILTLFAALLFFLKYEKFKKFIKLFRGITQ